MIVKTIKTAATEIAAIRLRFLFILVKDIAIHNELQAYISIGQV